MVSLALLQSGWLASQLPAARRYTRAAGAVERAQARRLAALVKVLGASTYGREVGLDRVAAPGDLRRLPVLDADGLAPWVERVAAGEERVLTTEPVEVLERTGGSSGAAKLVPYPARLRGEFAAAVAPWMVDLHRRVPGLLGTRSYWSVSRAARPAERTAGGLPVGFDDDSAYFGPVSRWAIARLMAVPGEVARAPDVDTWRHRTLCALVECGDLGLVSVWSPSFWLRLLDALLTTAARVADDVSPAARVRLLGALSPAGLDTRVLWPRLRVISAWGDGFAATQVPALRAAHPDAVFQPKGVLATEGVVSFPLGPEEGGVLAVTSHVIELRDVHDGSVWWPHEGRHGGVYQALLTTGGGLVRYALPDALEVVGRYRQVPRVRLVGRLDGGSDLVGEKLTAGFVQAALAPLVPGARFAMLVPDGDTPRYILVVDRLPGGAADAADAAGAADALALRVEAALLPAAQYAYARELGQLRPAVVRVVPDAWARWEAAVEALGLTLGDQKPGWLEARPAVVRALTAR